MLVTECTYGCFNDPACVPMLDKEKASVANAADALSTLEVDSNGCLHHSWGTSGCRRTKRTGSLQQLAKLRPATNNRCSTHRRKAGRAASTDLEGRRRIDRKGHPTVDIPKIRSIEKVIRFPSQLDGAIFSKREILEERDVGIKCRRQPHEVSLKVADATER